MFHYSMLNILMMHSSKLRYLMFQYLILHCLMLHYLLLHYLSLQYFNVILFCISPLMLQYFNVSVFDVARFEFALLHCCTIALLPYLPFHYSMLWYVNLTQFYVALLMLHYLHVALFTAPPFNVVLY